MDDETVRTVLIFLGPQSWFSIGPSVCKGWYQALKHETRLRKELECPTLLKAKQLEFDFTERYGRNWFRTDEGYVTFCKIAHSLVFWTEAEAKRCQFGAMSWYSFPKGFRAYFYPKFQQITVAQGGIYTTKEAILTAYDVTSQFLYSWGETDLTEWPSQRCWKLSLANGHVVSFSVCQKKALFLCQEAPSYLFDLATNQREVVNVGRNTSLHQWHNKLLLLDQDRRYFCANTIHVLGGTSRLTPFFHAEVVATVYKNDLYIYRGGSVLQCWEWL